MVAFTACTYAPSLYQEKGSPSTRSQIHTIIQSSGLSTNLGIKIVSIKSNKTLYELNANSLFNPASNNKLYTCISALSLLDTAYSYTTSVYHNNNKLYLVGGGDPDLSLTALDSLAEIVSKTSDKFDSLILDDSFHDAQRFGEGWMWDEGSEWYAAQISALSVNDNCVDFYVSPGELGQAVQINFSPNTNYIQVTNDSKTVADTTNFMAFKIDRDWMSQTNNFSILGNLMDTTSIDTFYRNVDDPTLFTGNVFAEMLQSRGMNISNIGKGSLPKKAELIATHQSESLINSLENLMVESDNLTAELTLKLIGREQTDIQGNWDNGLTAIKTFLQNEVQIDTTQFRLADGSGVSRYNYSSPNHFIQLLTWAYNQESVKDKLLLALPNGGDGTLEDRFPNHKGGNRVFAKTGSLSGVTSLSGYVFTKSGEPIVFSILMNGFSGSSAPFRKLQDQIVTYLTSLK